MTKLEESTVSMPHDKGYKRKLSKPGEFLHFLKKYVGAAWTLELVGAVRTAYGKLAARSKSLEEFEAHMEQGAPCGKVE